MLVKKEGDIYKITLKMYDHGTGMSTEVSFKDLALAPGEKNDKIVEKIRKQLPTEESVATDVYFAPGS